jgi:hypothetical protein
MAYGFHSATAAFPGLLLKKKTSILTKKESLAFLPIEFNVSFLSL